MTERDILIAAVSSLAAAIGFLFIYIKNIHEKNSRDQKETIESVTKEMTKSSMAIEHNTRAFEKLIGEIDKISKR